MPCRNSLRLFQVKSAPWQCAWYFCTATIPQQSDWDVLIFLRTCCISCFLLQPCTASRAGHWLKKASNMDNFSRTMFFFLITRETEEQQRQPMTMIIYTITACKHDTIERTAWPPLFQLRGCDVDSTHNCNTPEQGASTAGTYQIQGVKQSSSPASALAHLPCCHTSTKIDALAPRKPQPAARLHPANGAHNCQPKIGQD